MKRAVAVLCLAGWTAAVAVAQEAAVKIAVMNVQKALVGTKDGKKALQDLNARVAPKQKEFDARQQEIVQLQDRLTKGANLLSEDNKAQLEQEIETKKKKLERDTQDAQEDVQTHQRTVLQGLSQNLTAVVTKYARDNKYALVVETGSPTSEVIYSADSIDITQPVIALYDQTYK